MGFEKLTGIVPVYRRAQTPATHLFVGGVLDVGIV